MLLPNLHQYVRCCRDSAIVELPKLAVVLTYATKVLNNGSDITESDVVLSGARVYKESVERRNARTFVDTFKVPNGYVSMQTSRSMFQSTSLTTAVTAASTSKNGTFPALCDRRSGGSGLTRRTCKRCKVRSV